jgi:hypothetical protein
LKPFTSRNHKTALSTHCQKSNISKTTAKNIHLPINLGGNTPCLEIATISAKVHLEDQPKSARPQNFDIGYFWTFGQIGMAHLKAVFDKKYWM